MTASLWGEVNKSTHSGPRVRFCAELAQVIRLSLDAARINSQDPLCGVRPGADQPHPLLTRRLSHCRRLDAACCRLFRAAD